MREKQSTYKSLAQRLYSVLMLLLLLWLTVSTPFVYEEQQQVSVAQGMADDDDSNPLSGTNEEKVESGVNTLSEFLHEQHHCLPDFTLFIAAYKCHPDELYCAFHPELLVPPPEGLL